MPLLGVLDRSELTSDYSLQLGIVICLCASMKKHVFATCTLSCDCTLYSCDSSESEMFKALEKALIARDCGPHPF